MSSERTRSSSRARNPGRRRSHGGRAQHDGGGRRPRETSDQRAARIERRAAALAALAPLRYPEDLPVVARKDDIATAIRDHQVVVIAGETGSGKTTQIPKICLELGRGVEGLIGHTQPRRIAARSVAERIAEETRTDLGTAVGYQVRFTDHSQRDTLVKVMTDGILLSEMQRDRELRRYDTIIIDEAHERSLNIDFILGYLRQLLPRRPDLKVIITSATIDPQRFAEHFAVDGRPAPIIEVSGRTYPVEVRYRPLVREQGDTLVDVDQVTGICEAVEELWTEGTGDILVFLSGEREIRDAADALTGMSLPQTEILPLYGRLSAAEQHRVFSSHSGRRVVLATNVAETSLTVPGIRYVVDAGTARISRYSQRTKVQRLPIEPISQASAAQRSGRCGRVADGIAIRLYSREDFDARPAYTDPEILRTNLASVILQMTALGLGDIVRFPFVDPPDSRQVADGVRLLEELGCIDGSVSDPRKRLTAYGRKVARLPVDPRLARMLLEAETNGALRGVLVIVAARSIQDPRERPADKKAQADQSHARFKDEHSDFMALLNLWRYLKEQRRELSGSAFRRMCKREYLHYLRIREWQDLHSQLKQACKQLELTLNSDEADADRIHQALLAGLLSHIGLRDPDKRDYLGARGARFGISPGSALFRKQPQWVMSAELVETSRLWARVNARTDPAWIEKQAQHLVKRSYSEPHWSKKRASAVAKERVTLYGVPLVVGRTVGYARVNPEESRDLFIRQGLVEGEWDTHHEFFHANRELVRRLGELEERARRRDLLVDDETLVDFYDERLPADVVSGRHFDSWWKKARRENPDLLTFTEDLLVSDEADEIDADAYPQEWHQGDLTFAVSYQFEPGTQADGVTVHIPVEVLNQVQDAGFDWQVPGLREDLAIALLKSLPKALRRNFVPTPDHARAALAAADPRAGSITEELGRALRERTGVAVAPDAWDWDRVPDHLRVTFRIEGDRGRPLGEGKDLEALQSRLRPEVRRTMQRVGRAVEREGLQQWDFGRLQERFERRQGDRVVHGFPAVVDQGGSVAVRVLPTEAERDAATRLGVRRLLLLNTTAPWKRVLGLLTNAQKLALGHNPHGSVPALLDDCLAAAVDSIVAERPGATVRDEAEFDEALATVKREVVPRVIAVVEAVGPVLDRAREVELALAAFGSPRVAAVRTDLQKQLAGLVFPGFVAATGYPQVKQLERYLRGMLLRAEHAPTDLARDADRMTVVQRCTHEYDELLAWLPPARRQAADVRHLRWMLEELRVSLFAQSLGTAYPVSEKRIYKAMDALPD
jgi:ATP-dependent helicase HrpA